MGIKKRKREEAAAAEQKPGKRIKNKAKYLPKGNKARKKAAAQLMNGANAIPVRVRDGLASSAAESGPESESKEDVPMTEAPKGGQEEDQGKESNANDFFMIDTTPMDAQEVEEKTKSKGQKKRELKAQKEEQMTEEERAAKEEKKAAMKEIKKKEDRIKREKNALAKKEKRELKAEKKRKRKELIKAEKRKRALAKQEEKRKNKKKVEEKAEEKAEEEESDSSSSDSDSSSDSSDSESEVDQKTPTTSSTSSKEKKTTSKKNDTQPAKDEEEQPGSNNKSRFIVFVGNLPFTANVDSVKAHFSKITPISVRVATDKKDAQKCRGFGFVEFEQFDRMQTCLKLYHHSSFDDGKSPARKINVELTAGGGGKSATRKTKLREKNQKLTEERAKLAAEKGKKKKENSSGKDGEQDGGDKNGNDEEAGGEFAGIHPSRLNRMV